MGDDVTTEVELEAEDTLAVRLKSLHVKSARETAGREILQRQSHAMLEVASLIEGGLALLEVDGVSKAVLMRTPNPTDGKFVQVILRGGNSIELDAKGGALFMSRENYEALTDRIVAIVEGSIPQLR